MSMLYDDAQEAIGIESRRVVESRFDKARLLALLETNGEYDTAFWDMVVAQGWTALTIGEDFGGLGLGLVELGLVAQAAGAVAPGAPFLTPSYGVAHAIEAVGDEALKRDWLPRLALGEAIAAVAFPEGSTPLPHLPTVTFDDGKLTVCKASVTGGLKADVALVWASHAGEPALVVAGLDTVRRDPIESFDNSRLFADLTFAETPGLLLASGDRARVLALDVLARMAVVTAHEQVGGAEALLFMARDYALTRKAFGQPIGAFQSVKHRIAEIYGLIELARANCINAAARAGKSGFLIAAADARLSATEAYDTAARDCIQIHGGIGVTWEQGLHLHMRRARTLAIEQGNMLFWEDLLVEQLTGVAA
jgi:acyl-CoA dehydrogenase